jgi:very-short-patch-repair endonuclease
MEATPHKNTLIGMVLRKQDLLTAQRESWYRIPVRSAPEMVKSGTLSTLALYQTKAFGDDKYTVRWWSDVEHISIKKRVELLPDEAAHPRAEEPYYRIQLRKPLQELPKPIASPIPRRNPFITTTRERLREAKDFNDLFCGSPLEERLWLAFRAAGIPVQREFMVSRTVAKKKTVYYLDFAMFCKDVNIAIECDGNTYHNSSDEIEYDKDRDVKVQNMRFAVYRFTTDKIMNHLEETVQHIKQAVKQYGGIVDALNPSKILYKPRSEDLPGQEALFQLG